MIKLRKATETERQDRQCFSGGVLTHSFTHRPFTSPSEIHTEKRPEIPGRFSFEVLMFTPDEIRALIAAGKVEEFYNDRTWRNLSKDIIKENRSECMMCKAQKVLTPATTVHHVKHLKEFPELAYSRTYIAEDGTEQPQLVPLCHECHEKAHKRGIYAEKKGYMNDEKW